MSHPQTRHVTHWMSRATEIRAIPWINILSMHHTAHWMHHVSPRNQSLHILNASCYRNLHDLHEQFFFVFFCARHITHRMCHVTPVSESRHVHEWWYITRIRAIPISSCFDLWWYGSFMNMTWLTHRCDLTHSMCNVTHTKTLFLSAVVLSVGHHTQCMSHFTPIN